jgi:hypothetical protein
MRLRKMSYTVAVLVGIASMLALGQADAATLVSADLNSAGDGLITIDKSTSLEWLDLTATVGQSRAQVLASSYVMQGFRYATQSEVTQLWEDAGSSGAVESAALLIDLMGCTSSVIPSASGCIVPEGGTATQDWNIGFFGSGPTDAGLVDILTGSPPLFPPGGTTDFDINFGAHPEIDILNRHDVGSYLVRDAISAVPEPDVWVMLIFGFGLTGGLLRYRRSQLAVYNATCVS